MRRSQIKIFRAYPSLLQAAPLLAALGGVVRGLNRALEPRVYVALCRGLWEITAQDVTQHLTRQQDQQDVSEVRVMND